MGAAIFSISKTGQPNKNVRGAYVTGGAHTTSTSATSLTDGAAGSGSAVTGVAGDTLTIQVDENARIKFGGGTATATDGLIIFANETTDLEISETGTIRIIDVA